MRDIPNIFMKVALHIKVGGFPKEDKFWNVTYDLPTKVIMDSQSNKVYMALSAALRSKEVRLVLRKLMLNTGPLSISEILHLFHQWWKFFDVKCVESEYDTAAFTYPLLEELSNGVSLLQSATVPGFLFLSRDYSIGLTWCADRGGNSLASSIFPKLRSSPTKQVVSKFKSLPRTSMYATPQLASSVACKPRSNLAISAKAKAELKSQSVYQSFPSIITCPKAFNQPTSSLQDAFPPKLLTLEGMSSSTAATSVLGSKETPGGRHVPKDPVKGQTGPSSYKGGQTQGKESGSAPSGGTCSSGVGGASGASGGGGGGDPPWKRTGSLHDDEPEEEEDTDSSSDEEPELKPKPKIPQESEEQRVDGAAVCEDTHQHRYRKDSGTSLQFPVLTSHSGIAEDVAHNDELQNSLIVYNSEKSHHKNQSEHNMVAEHNGATPFSYGAGATPFSNMNLPQVFAGNYSNPSSPSWSLHTCSSSPPASPSSPLRMNMQQPLYDSAILSESRSSTFSSLSDTSVGIAETQQPQDGSEQPVFSPLPNPHIPQPSTTIEYSSSPSPTDFIDGLFPFPIVAHSSNVAGIPEIADNSSGEDSSVPLGEGTPPIPSSSNQHQVQSTLVPATQVNSNDNAIPRGMVTNGSTGENGDEQNADLCASISKDKGCDHASN